MKRIPLILILLFGLTLRFYPYLTQEFSLDERFTYNYGSQANIYQQFKNPVDDRPPLYYSLIKVITLVSSNKLILRLPSIVFSLLSIILIYKIFELFLKKYSIHAALIASINPLLIQISWQARDYSLLFLLEILTIYLLTKNYLLYLDNINKNFSVKKMLPLLITILFGILTSYLYHLFIFATILALIIFILIENKGKLKNSLEFLFKFGILLLPIVLVAVLYLFESKNNIINYNQRAGFTTQTIQVIKQTLSDLLLFNIYFWQTGQFALPLTISIALITTPFTYIFKQKRIKTIVTFFYIQTILCILTYLFISKFYVNLILARGLISLSFFAILITTFSIYSLSLIKKTKPIFKFFEKILLFLILILGIASYLVRYQFIKQIDWKEYDWAYPLPKNQPITALHKLIDNSIYQDDTKIIIWPQYFDITFSYECRNNCNKELGFNDFFYLQKEESPENINDAIKEYSPNIKKLIVVYDEFSLEYSDNRLAIEIDSFLQQNCSMISIAEIEYYFLIKTCQLK